jgi:hypothetical protein
VREENRRITVAQGVRRLEARHQRHLVIALLCGAALTAGCSKGSTTHTLEESRVIESSKIDFGKTTTTAERFGVSGGSSSPHGASPHGSTPTTTPTAPANGAGLDWTMPAGWTEQPPSTMRTVNLRPANDERAECYLTMLAGDAGGLAANVNRWRTQLGLSTLSAKDLDALLRIKFFNREAVFVDFSGTWKGMSGGEGRAGWRMLGVLLCEPGGSGFLKMTGPEDLVAKEREAFITFAKSLRPKGAAAPSDGNTTTSTDPSTTPAVEPGHEGHDHAPGEGHGNEQDPAPKTESAAGFTFTTPAGWRRAPDRPARAFTLFAGSGESLECYVTTLSGDAGGALANVNRWRGQLGLTSVTDAELAAMPTIDVLGRKAVLVECDGTAASLLGISCNDASGSVFVKMTGPRDLVKAQRAAFLAFCGSLTEAK